MRSPRLRASARRLLAPALASALALATACSPATTGDIAGGGGTGTSGTLDKSAFVTYAHILMTATTASSALGWKTNGVQKATGTAYLATLTNDTVKFASSSPLVTFEANNNGGTTRFLSEARLLVDGQRYSAFAFGIIGATNANYVPNLLLAPLDTLTPAANKAHVRFAHFIPGVAPVDVWSGAPGAEVKVVTALAYGAISDYVDITAAGGAVPSINVIVTPTGVAPGGGNIMSIAGISNIANPFAFTLALIYTASNFSAPSSKSLGIYLER